jgi:hypothetical protein
METKEGLGLAAMGLALAAALAGGCAWVKLKPAAEDIVVARDEHVQNCRRLGQTTSRTTDMVAGVPRGAGTVSEELERLARNAAVEANADTIVPVDKPWWGEQKFNMYRCRP